MSYSPEEDSGCGSDLPIELSEAAQYTQRVEQENRRVHRIMGGVLVASAVAAGVSVWDVMEHPSHPPAPPTLSCKGFGNDVLHTPEHHEFGLPQGIILDPEHIATRGMTDRRDFQLADGSAVKSRDAGSVTRQGDKLTGQIVLSRKYAEGTRGLLESSPLRWGACQLRGGLKFTATSTEAYTNGEYNSADDSVNFIVHAGASDKLYQDERDLYYVGAHEIGHSIRARVLKQGTDKESLGKIKKIDSLYEKHLALGLEDYRQAHGKQLSADLDELLLQYKAVNNVDTNATKGRLGRAIAYIKEKLERPNGLSDIGISRQKSVDYPEDVHVGLRSVDAMISAASQAVESDDHVLFGLSEFFESYPGKVDKGLLDRNDNRLHKFLSSVFLSEHTLPGNTGGHPWDNSNETFASLFCMTQFASPEAYARFVNGLGKKYQALSRQELETMKQLRDTINPKTLGRTS